VSNFASTGPTWPTITSNATVTTKSGQTYTKNLQSTTGPTPLFGNAIASSDSYVSFVAGGTVDSWNSDPDDNPATASVPYSFTAGNTANYAAVIAAKGNGTNGVMLTQATVRGYVATFGEPVSYSTSGSPAGKVLGPTTPAGVNVDSSRLGKSAFVPVSVFSVTIPPAAVPPDSGGGGLLGFLVKLVVDLVAALLSGPGDSYKTSDDLNITDAGTSLTIDRPMKLVVNGNLNISGSGRITIEPTGSLELYVTGDVTIGGNGIRNQTNVPKKMALFCTSASTTDSLQYTTSENFCGVIFSENKPIDIRQNATFYGALLSRQYVRFSTNATAPVFHYDSALRNVRFAQVSTPYIVKKVTEL
jgi:hypothetical protein